MKRQDAIAIRAELEHIANDVRDLEVSPSRAAALQCLADAMMHLARIEPIQTSPFPSVAARGVEAWAEAGRALPPLGTDRASVPPSCAENVRARAEISRSFQRTHEILKGIK